MDRVVYHPVNILVGFLRGALFAVLLLLTSCNSDRADYSLTLGGDLILARAKEPIFFEKDSPINPWMPVIDQLNPTNDWFFANLESPLGLTPDFAGEMNLCAESSEIRLLQEGGLDGVTLANNHNEDCGDGGSLITSQLLQDKNLLVADSIGEITYFEPPQVRIALVAVNTIMEEPLDVALLLTQIRQAADNATLVLVSIHWGSEYQAGPANWQQKLAQEIADAGADVIWGHHPHVLQRMEWLRSSDGRDVFVMYSLGNLLSDQFMLPDTQQSVLVRLFFKQERITSIEILPVFMQRSDKMLEWVTDPEVLNEIYERLGLEKLDKTGVRIIFASPN